jgi:hypothetical protein
MTEDERTRLIQQINMGANLHSHQMDAVMGALTYLGWQPPKQEGGMTQTNTPARCEPPVVDPHAALRDDVVVQAMRYAYDRTSMNGDAIIRAVETLRAAMSPPDPAKALEDAVEAMMDDPTPIPQPVYEHMCRVRKATEAVKAAIAALRKGAVV